MAVFKSDLTRSFAVGFALGCAALFAVMGSPFRTSLADDPRRNCGYAGSRTARPDAGRTRARGGPLTFAARGPSPYIGGMAAHHHHHHEPTGNSLVEALVEARRAMDRHARRGVQCPCRARASGFGL